MHKNAARFVTLTAIGATMAVLSACGDNVTERAATGGLGGLVIAGPIGAVAGATAGAVTSP